MGLCLKPWEVIIMLKMWSAFLLLVLLTGCGSSHQDQYVETTTTTGTTSEAVPSAPTALNIPEITSKMDLLVPSAIDIAFIELGKKSPNTVKTAATDLVNAINTSVLPALNGSTALTAQAVTTLMEDNVLTKVDPVLQGGIGIAATVLDSVLPEPNANTVLTADQLTLLRAFFTDLAKGSQNYLANIPPATKAVPKSVGKWFYCPPPKK